MIKFNSYIIQNNQINEVLIILEYFFKCLEHLKMQTVCDENHIYKVNISFNSVEVLADQL
jgi:hypothetical protein